MNTLAATAPRPTPAERATQDRLLSGVLQLFSLIANADGDVHEDEIKYVQAFLEALHPEDTRRLMEEFQGNVAQKLALEPTVAALKDEFSYEEKLFVLGKSCELLDGHGITPGELEAERAIAKGLGIEEADAVMIEQHLLHDAANGRRIGRHSDHVHVLRISDDRNAPDQLCLPLPGLQAEIFALAGGFYIRQRDDQQIITVGSHRLRRNFLTKIRRLDPVRIGSYVLRQGDLPFYLHQASKMDQPQTIYLTNTGHTFSLGVTPPATPAKLELYLEGMLIIASANDPTQVQINGQPLVKPRRLILGDTLSVSGIPLNVRKLLFNHLPDEYTFRDDGAACTISNKPDADIHIPDRQGRRWQATLKQADGNFHYDAGDCPHPAQNHGKPLAATLHGGDRFQLAGFQVELSGRTIRRYPPGVQSYGADGVSFVFPDRSVGLDGVAFEAERGDLVCVLGPSGCGKSTLLSILTGQFAPTRGAVRLDGKELHSQPALISRIGYVPQDDLLFENLTVGENLEFSARLRDPAASPEKIEGMVRKALREVGLRERRAVRAGGPLEKTLSGGERKRLNIGLELLGDYEILLLDEPTSGLSSGDAMKVIEVLKNRSLDGGIVFVVAHQPSAKLLELFDKVLLLDKGGKVAFFGDVPAAFRYFHEHEAGEVANSADQAAATLDADFLFEALERSSLRIDGTPDLSRRHPPVYWQQRFAKYRDENLIARLSSAAPSTGTQAAGDEAGKPQLLLRAKQFFTLLQREALNKTRNAFNLMVSLGSAAGLAIIVGLACRESVDGNYELAKNFAYGNFLFLTTVVVLFLALSGSVTEIVKDRAIRLRERLLGIPPSLYLLSKLLPLLIVLAVQVVLYQAASFTVLDVRELWGSYWLILGVTGFAGIAIGLFFSALPGMTDKAASALIPILLVPQIILSGANPFPFHRMAHLHWPDKRPTNEIEAGQKPPWTSQLMPSRWTYESLICLQRDHGFEAAYHAAIALQRDQRKAERTVEDASASPEDLAKAKATLARLTPAVMERAEKIKEAGGPGGWGEHRRMTKFVNSFSPSGTPSAPPTETKTPWGSEMSRAWWDALVLAAMGTVWLLGAWIVLVFGARRK